MLTKIDIMDKGTNALSMLRNEVLPLRLGYIAVVNRSQQDIQQRTSVTQARENEGEFFRSQGQYKAVEAQCGIPALSKRCGPRSMQQWHGGLVCLPPGAAERGAVRLAVNGMEPPMSKCLCKFVSDLPANSLSDLDNSGCSGPCAEGVKHLECAPFGVRGSKLSSCTATRLPHAAFMHAPAM